MKMGGPAGEEGTKGACCPPDSHPTLLETPGFMGTTITIEGVDSAGEWSERVRE
jgi:hypothetical protein